MRPSTCTGKCRCYPISCSVLQLFHVVAAVLRVIHAKLGSRKPR